MLSYLKEELSFDVHAGGRGCSEPSHISFNLYFNTCLVLQAYIQSSSSIVKRAFHVYLLQLVQLSGEPKLLVFYHVHFYCTRLPKSRCLCRRCLHHTSSQGLPRDAK